MNDKHDPDVPFYLSEDDEEEVFSSAPDSVEDDGVFSSVPPGDGGDEVFSSAPSSGGRSSVTTSGGYAAVSSSRGPDDSGDFNSYGSAPGYPPPAPGGHGGETFLEILDAHGATPHEADIPQGRTLLGASDRCDVLLDDPFVSSWHAALTRRGPEIVLEDMGSLNGVYLRIADEFVLEDADEIVVGNQRFIFRAQTPPPELFSTQREALALGAPTPHEFAHLIRVLEGGRIGGLYPLHEVLLIGRAGADVSCPDDPDLEEKHASIERRGHQFYLYDLQTNFGTYIRVNGAVELIPGDCFLVGNTRLRVHA